MCLYTLPNGGEEGGGNLFQVRTTALHLSTNFQEMGWRNMLRDTNQHVLIIFGRLWELSQDAVYSVTHQTWEDVSNELENS